MTSLVPTARTGSSERAATDSRVAALLSLAPVRTTPPVVAPPASPAGSLVGSPGGTWTTTPAAPTHLTPNILLSGVTHAGAGDLAGALGRHPQVKLPVTKRIDHYAVMRYGRGCEQPLEAYDRHFASWNGQRYRLESSPIYFDGGRELVRAVARDLTDCRVLLLLRDPADRLWTAYTDKIAAGRLPRAMSYETFVERCLALRLNGADRFEGNRHFRTLSSGFYAEYLPHWLDTFGRRARVVFAEDLAADPAANLVALFDWLGLDATQAAAAQDCPGSARGDSLLEVFESEPRRRWSLGWRTARHDRAAATEETASARARLFGRRAEPRQRDRVRARVETLYAGANRELAALLRDRGYTALPSWLARA